jgi:16S rRNA (uracil1498-N3)-methyltransferase
VNLILFEPDEIGPPLPRSDPRAVHLLTVLRRGAGDTFDAGLVNGPRGKGTLVAADANALTLSFAWGDRPPPPPPVTLIIGLPRPQTARDILRDATALGATTMHFVLTAKGEPSYARSTLWTTGEWRRHLITGAAQAFDTYLPEVTHGRSLLEVVSQLPGQGVRFALDNYEATVALGRAELAASPVTAPPAVVLAFGPERGWAAADRAALRGSGFTLVNLGPRILRTEAAVTAALALVRAKLGLI